MERLEGGGAVNVLSECVLCAEAACVEEESVSLWSQMFHFKSGKCRLCSDAAAD